MQTILGSDGCHPERALLLGPAKVLSQEHENLRCRSVDLDVSEVRANTAARIAELLRCEITEDFRENICAYRGPYRWVPSVEQVHLSATKGPQKLLRQGGTYVITGGTGGIGLTFAKHLAESAKANLLLTSRSGLPPRGEWQAWLDSHDAKDSTSEKFARFRNSRTSAPR